MVIGPPLLLTAPAAANVGPAKAPVLFMVLICQSRAELSVVAEVIASSKVEPKLRRIRRNSGDRHVLSAYVNTDSVAELVAEVARYAGDLRWRGRETLLD